MSKGTQQRKLAQVIAAVIIGVAMPAMAADDASFTRLKDSTRFGAHLIKSHTIDVITSPISAACDLTSLTANTGEAWLSRADIALRANLVLSNQPTPEIANRPGMDLELWESWLDKRIEIPETSGTVEFLIGGDAFYNRLNDAIDSATESIQMQTYIFDNDDIAMGVADRLKAKSHSTDVKILYDGLGTIMAQQVKAPSLPNGHQQPWSMHSYLTSGNSNVQVRRIHNRWLMSDHCKSTIIDHERAFVGGMNIGREYRHDWHDMMVEVRGPIVGALETEFSHAWGRARKGDSYLLGRAVNGSGRESTGKGLRLLQTTPMRSEIADAQIEAIRRARDYIFIENAYFADDMIVHQLCKARKRGVDVRVIIPDRGNHGIMTASNKLSINKLVNNGVRVYRYPGMSHIKAAVFDGWACFGTANYDKLSLAVNRELNIATSDKEIVDRLVRDLFLLDMSVSDEVRESEDATVLDRIIELLADEA
jgi:cardiolipin synthase